MHNLFVVPPITFTVKKCQTNNFTKKKETALHKTNTNDKLTNKSSNPIRKRNRFTLHSLISPSSSSSSTPLMYKTLLHLKEKKKQYSTKYAFPFIAKSWIEWCRHYARTRKNYSPLVPSRFYYGVFLEFLSLW